MFVCSILDSIRFIIENSVIKIVDKEWDRIRMRDQRFQLSKYVFYNETNQIGILISISYIHRLNVLVLLKKIFDIPFLWLRSMKLGSMCYVLCARRETANSAVEVSWQSSAKNRKRVSFSYKSNGNFGIQKRHIMLPFLIKWDLPLLKKKSHCSRKTRSITISPYSSDLGPPDFHLFPKHQAHS